MQQEPAASSRSRLQQIAFWSLACAIASVTVSIAASQILLAAAVVATLASGGLRRALRRPRLVFIPWLLFMLWTIIAALKAHDIGRALLEPKKFFLYSIVFLTPVVVTSAGELQNIYRMVFAFSAAAASAGLIQFAVNPSFDLDLHRRISGFMSHWMTYSGLLMLVLVTLAAYALCVRKARVRSWVIPLALLLAAGIYLSETRNAWLGSIAGLMVVFTLRRPRLVVSLAGLVIALYLLSPRPIQERLRSGWNQNDPETRGRLELAHTAVRLIKDNPWIGVGPKNVNREALRYRGSTEFPDWLYQHMHNNALQIAAERGIPGLALWLWLMAQMGWDAAQVFRSSGGHSEASMSATAALGCLVSLLVAGMFEYNFGDSEVLTMFLFLMAAPYRFRNGAHLPDGNLTENKPEAREPEVAAPIMS